MHSYSVAALVSKKRDLYLTESTSDIGEFSHLIDCHGVCGNKNEFSFVTNLLVLHATERGKVSAEYKLSLYFTEEKTNKLPRRSNCMFSFFI